MKQYFPKLEWSCIGFDISIDFISVLYHSESRYGKLNGYGNSREGLMCSFGKESYNILILSALIFLRIFKFSITNFTF